MLISIQPEIDNISEKLRSYHSTTQHLNSKMKTKGLIFIVQCHKKVACSVLRLVYVCAIGKWSLFRANFLYFFLKGGSETDGVC